MTDTDKKLDRKIRTLKIVEKNVYGETRYYPACPDSEAFARIAGTKTLTKRVLRDIARCLNYRVELIQPEGIEL